MQRLEVWAERLEGFVHTGSLSFDRQDEERFEYDEAYLRRDDAHPLYPPLPLQEGRFDTSSTRAAFFSLGPEGRVGHDIRTSLRAGRDAVVPILARLNHETVGALCFTAPGQVPCYDAFAYSEIDQDFLESFAESPEALAYRTMLESRLSLNGAVAKLGLARDGEVWLVPNGLAPSTHIVKAGSAAYPNQMLNEAICMRCARELGFDDAAQTELIVFGEDKVLLASKRFDRTERKDRPNGAPHVMRLHQADFCQLMGISVDSLKYTPSDELVEGYNTSLAATISQESSERYGDRSYLFDAQVFNYLIGNCDNHLKNYSMTWRPDWNGKTLSPIYDITCTTLYGELSREMGVGIGLHRSIDQIDEEDFAILARQLGIGNAQAKQSLGEISARYERSLMLAARELEEKYNVPAVRLAQRMREDGSARLRVVDHASLL